MTRKIGLLLLLTFHFFPLSAQPEEAGEIISFYPQYLFFHGIKAGWENHLKKNQWLIVSPEIYYDENTDQWDNSYKTVYGGGITLHHKSYLDEQVNNTPYFALQTGYNYFSIEGYRYGDNEINPGIHQISGGFTLGIQPRLFSKIFLDLYLGAELTKSFAINNQNAEMESFKQNMWDYAYTGPVFLIGLKICLIKN